MKVRLRSETYFIEGKEKTGIIPGGVPSVIVNYNEGGKVESVFYMHSSILNARTLPEIRKAEKKTKGLDRAKTPAELEKIVALLKTLSFK